VLYVERTYFADELPVETAEIVVSSDRYVFAYAVAIPART